MKSEYKIVYIDAERWSATGLPHDLGEDFDRWGDEGWELVKIEPMQKGGWFVFLIFFGFWRSDKNQGTDRDLQASKEMKLRTHTHRYCPMQKKAVLQPEQ